MVYKFIYKLLPNAVLIFCFGFSSSNAALADQIINVSPIIVQPEDLRDISQQMLAQDRINRDQELAIRGLIDDNQKLTDTAQSRQQDAALEKINQTMRNYRDALLARDRARIAANSQNPSPRYRDLVYLTENVDYMKGLGHTLQQKNVVIEEKYKTLTELKDELTDLNEKLKGQAANETFSKTPPQQENKIQFLTRRLGEMDQRIAQFDEILAEKDRQISQLKDNLAKSQGEAASRENKIRWLNQVLAAERYKAEYYQLTAQRQAKTIYLHRTIAVPDDRIMLAKHLIRLQQQELSLLEEKNQLWGAQGALYDQHVQELENKIKGFMASHRFQSVDLQGRMEELKKELAQKEEQVNLLKSELENKITEGADIENQLATLRAKIRSGQETGGRTDIYKQQLAEQQNKVDLLKQELENKIVESNKMTLMMSDYQQKLEARNNAYNDQLGQIAELNAQLQMKEAQIVKIKKDMYDLQELNSNKEKEDQSKELSLSMVEQKATGEEIKEYQEKIRSLKTELALERQQLEGMPSSDEIDYLRSGMKTAALQLKQKDETISLLKTNADKFENDFKLQSLDYQNLKAQLQNAYGEIHRDNKGLNDRDLEITRLKERYAILAGDWQGTEKKLQGKNYESAEGIALKAQLKQKDEMLAQFKANADEYERKYKEQSKEFQSLKVQLQDAYDEISRKDEDLKYKNLEILRLKVRFPQDKLIKLGTFSKDDVIQQKLKQALEEIDEQGRVINILVQKLQDAGKGVDLTQYLGKKI
jgi:chromosome segregation ATPase